MTSLDPSTRKLRVGLIGTGVGIRTYVPGFAATGRAQVVALSGSSLIRARQAADAAGVPVAYPDYRQLCADPSLDVVCVASPNEFHHDHYVAAAESGRHVVIEKPAAVDTGSVEKLLDVPIGTDQIVLVNHQLRFNPYLRALRASILAGELGTPYHLRIHQQGVGFLSLETRYSWRFDAERGGGVRLAMGTHLVDLLEFLLGTRRTDAVFGTVDVVVPVRPDAEGRRCTVTASASFSSMVRAGETSAILSASAAAVSSNLFDIDVLGTRGEAHFSIGDKLRISTLTGERTVREPVGVDPDEVHNRKSMFKTSFTYLARALAEAILDGRRETLELGSSLTSQVRTLRTLDGLLMSAQTGKAMTLGLPKPANARS